MIQLRVRRGVGCNRQPCRSRIGSGGGFGWHKECEGLRLVRCREVGRAVIADRGQCGRFGTRRHAKQSLHRDLVFARLWPTAIFRARGAPNKMPVAQAHQAAGSGSRTARSVFGVYTCPKRGHSRGWSTISDMAYIIHNVSHRSSRPIPFADAPRQTRCQQRAIARRRAEGERTAGAVFGVDTWPKRGGAGMGWCSGGGVRGGTAVRSCDSILRPAWFLVKSAPLIRLRSKAHRDALERSSTRSVWVQGCSGFWAFCADRGAVLMPYVGLNVIHERWKSVLRVVGVGARREYHSYGFRKARGGGINSGLRKGS